MQSDVSILTCAPQSTPKRLPIFIRGLKKEPNHLSTNVIDGSTDIKNVFLSHIGTKQHGFYSSPLVQPEPHKIPLDSVDTLLRNKSFLEPPSNPGSDISELLQLVDERPSFADKSPFDTSNSFWLSGPSHLYTGSMVKDEEPLKPAKLPAVDQIMQLHPGDSSPSAESGFFAIAPISSLTEPSVGQTSQLESPISSANSSVIAATQPILSAQNSSEIPFALSCRTSSQSKVKQSKCNDELVPLNTSYPLQSHQWRPIAASATATTTTVKNSKDIEHNLQKTQPRFILPNTSRPPIEVSLTKQALLVPISNPASAAGSLLLLPLAVAAALQQQKQQQQIASPTALLASLPTTGACGTTHLLLIRAADETKTASFTIMPSCKAETGLALVTTPLAETITIPSKSEAPGPRLPLSSSSTPVSPIEKARTPAKPLAPAGLPSAAEILPRSSFNKSLTSAKQQSSDDPNVGVPAIGGVSALRRRHQCPFCTKSCERKDNLQAHIRTHTGERPFPCRFCPKAFPQKDHLRAHIRTHTGEKPYHCPQCSKAFAQLGNLHRHVKTHRQ